MSSEPGVQPHTTGEGIFLGILITAAGLLLVIDYRAGKHWLESLSFWAGASPQRMKRMESVRPGVRLVIGVGLTLVGSLVLILEIVGLFMRA